MEDMDIIKMANDEAAHIITMDKDFGELVFKNDIVIKACYY